MLYQISRNGQMYGPYTLEDLQRYVASGNVLATDMAKSDSMSDWIPVSQVLGMGGEAAAPVAGSASHEAGSPAYAPVAAPYAGGTIAAVAASTYPDAPNLHWGLYLLFSVLTCGWFSKIFTLVQAGWLKRVQPNSIAIFLYIPVYAIALWSYWHSIGVVISMMHNSGITASSVPATRGFGLLYWALLIGVRFVMRNSLEEHFNGPENVGLKLDPIMTGLFGGVYFQSQLNKINAMKEAERLGAGRAY